MKNSLLTLLVFYFLISCAYSQQSNVVGFWEIEKVMVGEEVMTPVAKWTKINADGTYQSGNGWLQNSTGTWTFDKNNNLFSPEEKNGIKEGFGAFTVSLDGKKMKWEREEEGMKVVVSLIPIEKKPMSTADKIHGLWDLTSAAKGGENITSEYDANDKCYLFIRWDRLYRERTPEGERATGYWHINGHKPEVTFLSHQERKAPKTWRVEVEDTQLIMTGISDSNMDLKLTFERINEFPR
ncbi:hypothetical protein R9C00_05075 [Flammeovirgaceae bacterium SG7u.111]|nr:hypothetical protein [Flammeovirgaceae bacterium SG7u.132]WPO36817.1 hypothetical protein R9C00_05075 [Flammeovirgaceae bacterium SG7u.111]